jgi:flagellum-specific peptidoglycan hydrolase FlgJ
MKCMKQSDQRDVIRHSEYGTYADYIFAQARHESANFTSAVYKKNNNPFGMKVPTHRPFLGTAGTKAPDGGVYASYVSDLEAWKDLLKWFRYNHFPTDLKSVDAYVSQLKAEGYFTDGEKTYLAAVKKWMKYANN